MPQARLSDLLKYIRNIGAEDQDDDESIQDLCEPKYEEAKKEIPKVSTIQGHIRIDDIPKEAVNKILFSHWTLAGKEPH